MVFSWWPITEFEPMDQMVAAYRGQNLAPDVSERRWDGAGWMVFLQSSIKDKLCHGLEPSAIKL